MRRDREDIKTRAAEKQQANIIARKGRRGSIRSVSASATGTAPRHGIECDQRLACPKSERDLAFSNGRGNPDDWKEIVHDSYRPAQVAAGVVNAQGRAKYGGLHALRHFYASWCINRRVDGGLELPLKLVQARLGHASIQMTADRYGHLFPSADDGTELAAAEKALLRPIG